MNSEKTNDRLRAGDQVTKFFVIRNLNLKAKKDGTPFLVLDLGDAGGRISATIWEDAKNLFETFTAGSIVKIQGMVRTYNDALQLSVSRIRKAEPADQVTPDAFIPRAGFDIDALYQTLLDTVESITDRHLKNLLETVFHDPKTRGEFSTAPGGKLWHHAYAGGLLEHTMNMAAVCETTAAQYPLIHRDLLITGALLHDIGKLEEYTYEKGFIDFTDSGRLLGHITMGARRIESLIDSFSGNEAFPQELKNLVIHLILSHQGELAHGSPVLPATVEAIVLYYADEMDSKANAVTRITNQGKLSGEKWSPYINLLDRFIYVGGAPEDETDPPETLFDALPED